MVEDSDEEDLTDLVDGVNHIKSDGDIGVLCEDDTLLVFMDQLKILASRAVPACRSCKSHEVEIKDTYKGSAVYLGLVCKEGHSNGRWCSQPLLNRRVHSGDFLISATTVLSGNNFSKLKLWADMLKLKFPSEQQFFRVQEAYLVPTVDSYWQEHQQYLIQSFHGRDVIVLGDGCNDSPGHCAQYCSYTLMENDSKKILTLKTMDKRETDRKSAAMEKKALKACLEELLDKDVCVKELVTDGHLGITAMMSTDNKEQKGIFHSHDIWHVAKNLGKKLTKLSLKKDNRILRDWIKDIVNHFWYACKVAETEAQFKGIWVSVLHHVTDEHEWLISYGDDGCNECHHGPLAAEDRDKPWLHRIKNSAVLKDLSSVVMDKRLLKKVAYYLKFRSTAELEGFHQHLLMYCAKRFAYTPPVYRMRNLLAALNHNLHQDRSVQFNKNGSMRPVMASNGNPTDSSGVDLKMTLKSCEHTSKVEPTQTRRTNNPNQSSPMKRPDSAPPAVITDKELPSRETPVMASNENHTDLFASMDLKMTETRRKNNPNKAPSRKRPDSAPPAVITEKEMPSRETYLSTTDSSVFKVPQCLVRARGENLLEVCEDVLDEISRIDKPCVIVAIAGPYRTGKSYLMNRLADAQTGFAIGDTIQSTTKGIWVWCRDHPEQKDTVLILLDTEGIGDVEKGDSNHDNRIFTLATLISSVLVYNMKGAFDQEAVNKLSFVSEISKNIKFGGRCDEENLLLQSVLPGFVLALRDFSLKLMKDGRKITPDEYFEESLESKTDKSVSFNKPRECIRKFFQQDKRRCFAFPPPGDIDILENLECLTFEYLSKRFQTVAAMFVSYIYSQKPKQLQVSKPVNGPMFATLTRKYVDALARGAVPDVDDAFASAAKLENERVKDECMDMFRLSIEDVDLPLPSSSLDKHFTEARCSALEYMSTNVVPNVASVIEKHALMEMDLFRQQFQRQNEEEIEKHCTNVLLCLASFSNLQAGLQNKGYEVIGGHRKFKQDVDMVRQEYEQALRNYEQREIGLVWNSFANQLGPKETKILDKDDELSKEEKKREKEENEISMKRMKIELDKANQNALHKQMKELDEQQKKLNTELRRRDKEHEDKVTALQDKIASLESNKEVQKKMLDQITSLLEEDKREKKKANKKLEEKHRREREKREELEQKERERKGGFVINRVLNALWNN